MMLTERIFEVWFEVLPCSVTLLPCDKIYITDHFLIHFDPCIETLPLSVRLKFQRTVP